MCVKGLTMNSQAVVEKMLLLLTTMLQRLHSIVDKVYGSEKAAEAFLRQMQWVFPPSDTVNALFKKVVGCLLSGAPFDGKAKEESDDDSAQPVVNMVGVAAKEEPMEEVASPRELLEHLLQLICEYLRVMRPLYVSSVAQIHVDVLSLFTLLEGTPLLFADDSLSTALLDLLLILLQAENAGVAQALVTVRGDQKPLLVLLQTLVNPCTAECVKSRLLSLLLGLLNVSQAFVGLQNPQLFLHLLLPFLSAETCVFIHDVFQDVRNQRIRFLARAHTYGFAAPLLAHALLYSAMRPRAAGFEWVCYTCLQLLVLTNPESQSATQTLVKTMLEERASEKNAKEFFINESVTEDLLRALQVFVEFWNRSGDAVAQAPVATLDLDTFSQTLRDTPDMACNQLFHTLLWAQVAATQLHTLSALSPRVLLLLLLVPFHFEGLSARASWQTVCGWESALLQLSASSGVALAALVCYMRSSERFGDVTPLEKSALALGMYSALALWLLWDVRPQTADRTAWLAWLVDHASDHEIEPVVATLRSVVSVWEDAEVEDCCRVLVRRVCSIRDATEARKCGRCLAVLLLSHLSTGYTVSALLLLQHWLFAEERITLTRFVMQHLDDATVLQALQDCPQPLAIPLEADLLTPLLAQLDRSSAIVRVLVATFQQLLAVGVSLSSVEAASATQLLTEENVSVCVKHLPQSDYSQFLQCVLRLRPDLQIAFCRALFSPEMDGVYLKHFAELVPLVLVSLQHPLSHKSEALFQVMRESTFYTDLLQRTIRVDGTSEERECVELLAQEDPAFIDAVKRLDLKQLCRSEYESGTAVAGQLSAILRVCDLQGETSEDAVRIVLLRSLQALGKRWSKEGAYDPETSPHWDLVDVLLGACKERMDVLAAVAAKQTSTIVRLAKLLLKNRLLDPATLALLRQLLVALRSSPTDELTEGTVLELLQSHSGYQDLLSKVRGQAVSSDDTSLRTRWMKQGKEDTSLAEQFLLLLQTVLEHEPHLCSSSLFYQLLSLYSCSFSRTDVILRSLFVTLHKAGAASLESCGYLFGRFAPLSTSSSIQVPSTWLLEAVSGMRLRKTIESFPQANEVKVEKMEEEEPEEPEEEGSDEEEVGADFLETLHERKNSVEEVEEAEETEEAFDPSLDCVEALLANPPELHVSDRDAILLVDPTFFLPALHYWLNAATVDTRSYVSHGVASYLITCLTSGDRVVRQCASCLLQRVYELVLDASFYEQPQIKLVLMKLQNSIDRPTLRLSAITANFVSEALGIMMRPTHALYRQVNRYFLSHPTFSLTDTPLFNQLFLSDSENYRQERAWCLRYLLRGLQSERDYEVLARRHIVSQLQSFALSKASDVYTQKLCVAAIQRLVALPSTALLLYRNVNVLPWLTSLLSQAKSRTVVYAAVGVVQAIAGVEDDNEMVLESNLLLVLRCLLDELERGNEKQTQAECNRLLIPCMQIYERLCDRFAKAEMSASSMREMKEQFFDVWCVLLRQIQRLKERTPGPEMELLPECALSGDDFYLLCPPELLSMEECWDKVHSLLRRIKRKMPFDAEAFRSQENLYESLFMWCVC